MGFLFWSFCLLTETVLFTDISWLASDCSSYFSLLNAEIKGSCHDTQLSITQQVKSHVLVSANKVFTFTKKKSDPIGLYSSMLPMYKTLNPILIIELNMFSKQQKYS